MTTATTTPAPAHSSSDIVELVDDPSEKVTMSKIDALNRLEESISQLVTSCPFYGLVFRYFRKVATESIPTMGVAIRKRQLTLYYNIGFISKRTSKEMTEVLKHECLHVLFGHLKDSFDTKPSPEDMARHMKWNAAFDLAINCFLDKEAVISMKGLYPGHNYGQPENEFLTAIGKMPMYEASETYYSLLPKDDGEGSGYGTIDSHIGDDESMSESEKKMYVKSVIGECVYTAKANNMWGDTPNEIKSALDAYLNNRLDWKSLMRHILQSISNDTVNFTRKRINKRQPEFLPGIIRERQPRVAIAMDQSGSVSNDMVASFFTELSACNELIDFTLVPFDATVAEESIQEWEKGSVPDFERVRSGGTDFDAPTRWFNDNSNDYDAIFFMTDGGCSQPIACDKPRFWILAEGTQLAFSTDEQVVEIGNA